MLIRLSLTLISGFFLSRCAISAETNAEDVVVPHEGNCEQSTSHRPPVIRGVNIKLGDSIEVHPKTICVRPGDVLKFHVVGSEDFEEAEVAVTGKGRGDEWIKGDNSKGKSNFFFVVVPGDLLPESVPDAERNYYYSVIVNGTDHDPEVRVRNNYD